MAKRVITKIGDVFVALIDNTYKVYFQYIVNDLSLLNSDVIRVFKKKYLKDEQPTLQEIIKDDIAFYAHCVTNFGIKQGYWEKIGNIKETGDFSQVLFGDKNDEADINNHEWYVWQINKDTKHVGSLKNNKKKIYPGGIWPSQSIIYKIKYGYYEGVFGYYERNYLNT